MSRQTALYRSMPWLLLGAGAFLAARGGRRMRRIEFRGLSVVISGGSRGLGLELARNLAHQGARLSLLARDAHELQRARYELTAKGADVLIYPCDIRNRNDIEKTVSEIIAMRREIDVLINNAGIIHVAPFENLDIDDFRDSVDVHAWGSLHLIRAIAPHMQQRRKGRIVNISSIGGVVAIPHLLAYTMGKFALTGISDGFRAELAKDGIRVTTVVPGLMRTGSHVNATFKGQHRKEFTWFALSGANPVASTSVTNAAGRIIEACRYGDPRLTITIPAKMLSMANAVFPRLTAFGTAMAARLLPSPQKAPGNVAHKGWESSSWAAPSFLTRLSDREIRINNER